MRRGAVFRRELGLDIFRGRNGRRRVSRKKRRIEEEEEEKKEDEGEEDNGKEERAKKMRRLLMLFCDDCSVWLLSSRGGCYPMMDKDGC